MKEKRSPSEGSAQPDLFASPMAEGVGGRQEEVAPPPGGGGYLQNCRVFKFSAPPPQKSARDPRLQELHDLGLQRVWLEVAETIGVDSFMQMWRILDADPACRHSDGLLEITLKKHSAYLRHVRNRMIRRLHGTSTTEQIRKRVLEQFGEELSLRHIERIAKG